MINSFTCSDVPSRSSRSYTLVHTGEHRSIRPRNTRRIALNGLRPVSQLFNVSTLTNFGSSNCCILGSVRQLISALIVLRVRWVALKNFAACFLKTMCLQIVFTITQNILIHRPDLTHLADTLQWTIDTKFFPELLFASWCKYTYELNCYTAFFV